MACFVTSQKVSEQKHQHSMDYLHRIDSVFRFQTMRSIDMIYITIRYDTIRFILSHSVGVTSSHVDARVLVFDEIPSQLPAEWGGGDPTYGHE